jgi:hypothetical protein
LVFVQTMFGEEKAQSPPSVTPPIAVGDVHAAI